MVTHETYKSQATASGCCRARCASRARATRRKAFEIASGAPVEIGAIEKMSKSKKNLVDPDDIIAHYGADCARWFMLSDSPPERDVIWTEAGVAGAGRFIQRIWRLVDDVAEKAAARGTAQAGDPSAPRRWSCAAPPTRRSTRSAATSRACASTSPWPRSTS